MKVLLVNPPRFDLMRYGLPTIDIHGPPLGIASIAAFLEKRDVEVAVEDYHYRSWEAVEESIRKESPDIVGITTLSQQRGSVFRLIRLIKEVKDSIKIVLGGPHAHFMYEQILENHPVDFIVLGEGEETFLDLVGAVDGSADISLVKGIAYKDGGRAVTTGPREPIGDLGKLPFPAYHLFDIDGYPPGERLRGYTRDGVKLDGIKFTTYSFSRGCTGRCSFCSTFKFWGNTWRCRSPEKVVDDLEILSKEYGRRYITFVDDIFTVNKNKVIGICRGIIDRKLNILWDCETRVDFVSDEMLRWMRKAGCVAVDYGVESASREVLEAIHKKTTPERIAGAIRITSDSGIRTNLLLMVGNPGESDASISATEKLIKDSRPDKITVNIAMVFPGTALYELARSKGIVDDKFWLTERPAPFYTAEQPLRRLKMWSDRLMSANSNSIMRFARGVRSQIGMRTGFSITRQGIHRYKT
ncbi:B12-binding domain-containing radical SAM protein [Candidatus Omnitrophota bacterium]